MYKIDLAHCLLLPWLAVGHPEVPLDQGLAVELPTLNVVFDVDQAGCVQTTKPCRAPASFQFDFPPVYVLWEDTFVQKFCFLKHTEKRSNCLPWAEHANNMGRVEWQPRWKNESITLDVDALQEGGICSNVFVCWNFEDLQLHVGTLGLKVKRKGKLIDMASHLYPLPETGNLSSLPSSLLV